MKNTFRVGVVIVLVVALALAQTRITQVSIHQYGAQSSTPSNPPTNTAYVYFDGTNLDCLTSTGGNCLSSGGGVTSVFTRTGAVTASSGDYTVGQVTGAAPLASPTFTGTATTPLLATTTNCAASGTAANPSVVACGSAAAGIVYCDVAASAGTCTVNTTAAGTNSEILITPSTADNTLLSKTCNAAPSVVPAIILASKSNGVSFTLNMDTVAVNGMCFEYWIVNK